VQKDVLRKFIFIFAVFVLISVTGCIKVPVAEQKVLLIFSYHDEFPWVIEETRGTEEIFEAKPVKIDTFYLDTKRNTSNEWKKQIAEDAMNKISDYDPDIVIVFDDNACELVAKRYIGEDLPIVFCGMNGEPEDYGFPARNITGVIERAHFKETITLLKSLVPDGGRATIITDNSPSSQAIIARARSTALPIDIDEFYCTDDFDTWKAKVIELQSEVDVIGLALYHTIKEKGDQVSLPAESVLGWTLSNSRIPEFAIFDFTVRGGALCGVTLSGYEQGKVAAEIAVKILDGQNPANIPIQSPKESKPIVNTSRAKDLNIDIPTDMVNKVEIVQ
jgi:ABC-type uncharacterized transport system substrate-binding protein